MSKAAELIAGLETDAAFDSDGAFSLDREKARQKMRQFQLADPHRYVLLLVEAAALRGASEIVFDIDSDDMHMRFDAALSWEDLDELYTSLFVDRSSVEIRARRELALACNAVMALNPRFVNIESFAEDEQGVRARLCPDSEDEITKLDTPSAAPEGMQAPWTTIHVKDRFRPGLFVRFLRDIQGTIPEEELIRARCGRASISLTLDGTRVSYGLPTNLVAGVHFETEHLRGVAGLTLDPNRSDRSAIVLLSNGVEIATHEIDHSVDGLWFWVDGARFRKDVSQGDIVRGDPAYQDMLQVIARARNQVLGKLAELWHAGEFDGDSAPTADEVFNMLRACYLEWADAEWLRSDAGPLGRLSDMPLWRTVDQRWLSPRALVDEADKLRGIMYTEADFDGVMPLGWGPVIHVLEGVREIATIERVHPEAQSKTKRLEQIVPWELNRRKWRARPHEIELARGNVRYVRGFEQGEYRGRVGLRPGQLSDLRVVVDGCLLCEYEVDLGVIGLSAVITGPLKAAVDYGRPRQDRSWATALLLLLAQLPPLIEAWARDAQGGDMIKRCLVAITRPDFALSWLVGFGFDKRAAEQLLARVGAPSLLPELGLGADTPATAVARAVEFATVDFRRVTLADLDHARGQRERERGRVLVVDDRAQTSTGVTELIVHADADDLRLLAAVFGGAAIHDDTEAYLSELGRRSFEAKPKRYPAPPMVTWTSSVELAPGPGQGAGEIRGHVGIDAGAVRRWAADRPRRVKIEVFTHERFLCTVEERSWVPGVEAELEWQDAPVNEAWSGLSGSTWPLRRAVDQGLLALVRARAEETGANRPNADVRRLLWLAVVSPFVSDTHFRAWNAIRRHHGEDHAAAVDEYFDLLELFPGVGIDELREAMSLLLEAGRPTAKAVLDLLGRELAPPGGGREFQRGILEMFPLLESLPLLPLVSDANASLAQVLEAFEASEEIAYVEDRSLRWESDERLILRADEVDRVALIRLFGREVFTEVSGWIHERRNLERFESREQLDELRVPDASRLVGVEFERDDFCGELAIPDWSVGEGGYMRITFCHDRRVVEEIELTGALPVIGIVDDPHATLSEDYSGVDTQTARMASLRKLLAKVLADELLPKLADRYEELDARQRSLARTWIAAHWRRSSPRAGKYENRLTPAGRRFAALKLFRDVDDSERSLEELIARNREQRCLWYVERHPGHGVEPPFAIVEARESDQALLADLFPVFEDFSERWAARVGGDRRKRSASPLPPLAAPDDAIHAVELERHDMQGVLWLPAAYPFASGVILGAEGKLVETRRPASGLAALGVLGGLSANDLFTEIEFVGPQWRTFESRVVFLYSGLLNLHRRELARPEKVDFLDPEVARRRAVRFEILRAAVVHLAAAEIRGESFDAILSNLYKRLLDEPLLRLATGRLISVAVARKARPEEFAYLEIWDPKGPVLDADERARLLLGEEAPAKQQPPASEVVEVVEAEVVEVRTSEFSQGEVHVVSHSETVEVSARVFESSAIDLELSLDDLEVIGETLDSVVEPELEPEPDPVAELLERVREELRLLRERHAITLAEGLLDRIDAEPGRGVELVSIDGRVVFDGCHPRFVRALEDPDPIWVSFLASVAYTALNRWLEEVTDDDELDFHAAHAELLLSGLLDASVEPT
jgi:hypothetical protein